MHLLTLQQSIVSDMRPLNVKLKRGGRFVVLPYWLRVVGGRNLMLILMIDDRGCSVPPQSVCDSVIVSVINSTTVSAPSLQREPESKQK